MTLAEDFHLEQLALLAHLRRHHSERDRQLIGFGTEKAAQKFVQKLALKNIETFVKKRISKTAKGRTVYWYQVVTPPYDNKETLTLLVNKLAKEERLSGIYIGSC
jgi:hypothetical protein